jgi:hypothetical protein
MLDIEIVCALKQMIVWNLYLYEDLSRRFRSGVYRVALDNLFDIAQAYLINFISTSGPTPTR